MVLDCSGSAFPFLLDSIRVLNILYDPVSSAVCDESFLLDATWSYSSLLILKFVDC